MIGVRAAFPSSWAAHGAVSQTAAVVMKPISTVAVNPARMIRGVSSDRWIKAGPMPNWAKIAARPTYTAASPAKP